MPRRVKRWTAADLGARNPGVGAAPADTAATKDLRKALAKSNSQKLQGALRIHLLLAGLSALFAEEATFHPTRKWRMDFLCRQYRVAIELHGSVYTQGRHTRGAGMLEDCNKLNAALELGIVTLVFTAEHLRKPSLVVNQIRRVLVSRGCKEAA